MKKTLALIISAIMILSCLAISVSAAAWDGSTKTAFTGSGTAADPYVIDSAEKLAKLAELVNGGEAYAGKYFLQTADIDLGSKEWTPIGSSAKPFKGVYNGDNHEIKNLYISNVISQCGLFGYICSTVDEQAGISNLTLSGKIVSDGMTVDAGLGLLCGWCYKDATDGFKHTVIQNVVVNGDITVTNCAKQPRLGGVVGYVFDSVLDNVTFNGTINYSCSAVSRVGGIAGQTNRTTFRNCVNNGNITVVNTAGNATGAGIAAVATFKVEDVYTDFENCINNGKIDVYGKADVATYAAGILGQPYSSGTNYFYKFNNCANNGEIKGKTDSTAKYAYVSGIAAYANKGQFGVTNCVNTAELTAEGGPASRAGGIVGCFSGANTLPGVTITGNQSVGNALGYVTAGVDVSTNTANADAATVKALADTIKSNVKAADTKIGGFETEGQSAPATGDSMIVYAVIAVAVATLGTAVVFKKREN